MSKYNLNSLKKIAIVTYSDSDSNILAIAIKKINKDGAFKYELYKVDGDDISLAASSTNPTDFDNILYGKSVHKKRSIINHEISHNNECEKQPKLVKKSNMKTQVKKLF